MSSPNQAVFLSYASQDAEAARKICEALRSGGVEVWFDADGGLEHGDEWDAKIRKQIKECVLFIPVISANTQARHEGYFRIEWDLAAERARGIASGIPFILPVVIDDTREPDALVPDRFRMVQWTRLRPAGSGGQAPEIPPDVLARFLKLWSHRTGVLKHEAGVAPASSRPSEDAGKMPALPEVGRPLRGRLAWALAATAILFAAGMVVFQQRREAKPPEAAQRSAPPTPEKAAASLTKAQQLIAQARVLYEPWRLATADDLRLADRLLKEATDLEPANADGWASWAMVSVALGDFGFDRSDTRLRLLVGAAERAAKLAPDSPLVQLALAMRYDLDSATQNDRDRLLHSLIERPGAPVFVQRAALRNLAFGLNAKGKTDEALKLLERSASLPGGDPNAHFDAGSIRVWNGRYDEALVDSDRAIAMRPDFGAAQAARLVILMSILGDLPRARSALEQIPARTLRDERVATLAVFIWFVSGHHQKADELLLELPGDYLESEWFHQPKAVLSGLIHDRAGRREAALAEWKLGLRAVESRLTANPTDRRELANKAQLLALVGESAPAEEILRLIHQLARQATGRATAGTWPIYAALGRESEVADYFEKAIKAKVTGTGFNTSLGKLKFDPMLDPFRAGPRFIALTKEVDAIFAARAHKEATAAPFPGPPATDHAPPTPPEKSVAVLAFANLSDDKSNEYFSDGIADELLTTLQKISGLKVAARLSAWSFKGKNATVQEIGAKLGVAHVVEGSVQKSGDRVKISARLSRAATGEQVWSENFTRDLADVFAVQSEIAQTIVARLRGKLTGEDAAKATAEIQGQVRAAQRGGTTNALAHDEYLQGRYSQIHNLVGNLGRPVAHFHRAVELDPKFALAWAALARAHAWQASLAPTLAQIGEGFAQARRAADRSLELEPNLPEGLGARMLIQLNYDFDWHGARRSLQQARALAPLDPTMLVFALELDALFGQADPNAAIELVRQALTLDPMNVGLGNLLASCYQGAGRWAEAEAEWKRLIELNPQGSHGSLADLHTTRGQYAEAVAAAEKETVEWLRLNALATAQWGLKNVAAADAALRELIAKYGEQCGIQIAYIYAFRGEIDQVFAWLDRAYLQRDSGLPGVKGWQRNPNLRQVCADPRWPAFLRKLGMADDQLK